MASYYRDAFLCEVIEDGFGVCLGQATCVAAARALLRIRFQFSLRLLQFQNVYALMQVSERNCDHLDFEVT
jgi:hypothetical protein